jgi:4-amino-4-deoxy-L-arabinose transferase-like glycosyltransferase
MDGAASLIDASRAKYFAREIVPILVILVIAAAIRTYLLEQNGFGREYYAAGVRSMLGSWHNIFYNSFDPGGFVSIDKPPLAIWWQAIGAALLGFNGTSVLLPQAAAGLVSIFLLYRLIDSSFGRRAALMAALVLALTPVSIAVDRSNNTDSLLIAVLLAATLLGIRAALSGSMGWLCVAMAAVGAGFNVKMAAALPLAVVLALAFSLAHRSAPIGWHVSRHAVAALVLAAVSLAWVVAFDLTPAGNRPYAGSTRHNSMLELALVHNAASRFLPAHVPGSAAEAAAQAGDSGAQQASAPKPELTDTSPTGPLRLFRPRQAAQAAWLLPLALAGIVLAWRTASQTRSRLVAGILFGWLALYWVLLSLAAGPVHTYYLAVLAPPLAAFTGIAAARIWERRQTGELSAWLMAGLVLAVIGWQGFIFFGQVGFQPDGRLLAFLVAGAGLIATCAATLVLTVPRTRIAAVAVAAAGIGGLLAMPVLAASSVVLVKPNVAAPYADIAQLTADHDEAAEAARTRRRQAARSKLLAFLSAHQRTEKYLVAVPNAILAAPLILASGQPVMAMGGYLGEDPILTPARLGQLVADGEVRSVMLGGLTLAPERQQAALAELERWVRDNGVVVDERRWRIRSPRRDDPNAARPGNTLLSIPRAELFDVRPRTN